MLSAICHPVTRNENRVSPVSPIKSIFSARLYETGVISRLEAMSIEFVNCNARKLDDHSIVFFKFTFKFAIMIF